MFVMDVVVDVFVSFVVDLRRSETIVAAAVVVV